MIGQMSSDLHGVGIKLKTTKPRIFQNDIRMWITQEVFTEDGLFQVLFIIFLTLQPTGNTDTTRCSLNYDRSDVIRLTWSGNQVEDYKTQNFPE